MMIAVPRITLIAVPLQRRVTPISAVANFIPHLLRTPLQVRVISAAFETTDDERKRSTTRKVDFDIGLRPVFIIGGRRLQVWKKYEPHILEWHLIPPDHRWHPICKQVPISRPIKAMFGIRDFLKKMPLS